MMSRLLPLVGILCLFAWSPGQDEARQAEPATAPDPSVPAWPRLAKTTDGSRMILFQPQAESWEQGRKLICRLAVSYREKEGSKAVLAALRVEIQTKADMESRLVELSHYKILEASFPDLEKSDAALYERRIRASFPKGGSTIQLDRIITSLDKGADDPATKLPTKPPRILYAKTPSILVVLDGEPVLQRIGDGTLMSVVNTDSNLFRYGKTSTWYLQVDDFWLQSKTLETDWKGAGNLPKEFLTLPENPRFEDVRKTVLSETVPEAVVPKVLVTKDAAELIQTQGEPKLTRVGTTKLMFAENSEDDLFFHESENQWYVLISGRWFRSKTFAGPWTFATTVLPEDFSEIPVSEDAGRVRTSVPGTKEASETALAATVPQTATVQRKDAKVEVSYEGDPVFEPIAGIGVAYATNTSFDVFLVGEYYYLCYQGVWFVGPSAKGPWTVCDRVPDAIYRIPADHPKFHVTYVKVYDSTPEVVYVGYTSGYTGSYVCWGVLVWGTGYWYHRPSLYWHHCYHWYRYHHAFWGSHWRRHWRYHYRHRWYHSYGAGRHYNHASGRYRRSYAARRSVVVRRPSLPTYQAWSNKAVKRQQVRRQKNPMARPVRRGQASKYGDIYAGRDGRIYRKQGGEWQRKDKAGWQKASQLPSSGRKRATNRYPTQPKQPRAGQQRPQPKPSQARQRSHLQNDARARQQQQRAQQQRRYQQSRRRSYGGGARHGGGRRR